MTDSVRKCDDCGLIWSGEMLNLVDRNDDDTLGHYCPNCGGDNISKGMGR